MRVVLDTNVLVRATKYANGPAREQHRLTPEERREFVTGLDQISEHVALPPNMAAPISSDPDDDAIVQTGVAGRADVICTRDRHLLHAEVREYCANFGIRVLSDTELLAEFASRPATLTAPKQKFLDPILETE